MAVRYLKGFAGLKKVSESIAEKGKGKKISGICNQREWHWQSGSVFNLQWRLTSNTENAVLNELQIW